MRNRNLTTDERIKAAKEAQKQARKIGIDTSKDERKLLKLVQDKEEQMNRKSEKLKRDEKEKRERENRRSEGEANREKTETRQAAA